MLASRRVSLALCFFHLEASQISNKPSYTVMKFCAPSPPFYFAITNWQLVLMSSLSSDALSVAIENFFHIEVILLLPIPTSK